MKEVILLAFLVLLGVGSAVADDGFLALQVDGPTYMKFTTNFSLAFINAKLERAPANINNFFQDYVMMPYGESTTHDPEGLIFYFTLTKIVTKNPLVFDKWLLSYAYQSQPYAFKSLRVLRGQNDTDMRTFPLWDAARKKMRMIVLSGSDTWEFGSIVDGQFSADFELADSFSSRETRVDFDSVNQKFLIGGTDAVDAITGDVTKLPELKNLPFGTGFMLSQGTLKAQFFSLVFNDTKNLYVFSYDPYNPSDWQFLSKQSPSIDPSKQWYQWTPYMQVAFGTWYSGTAIVLVPSLGGGHDYNYPTMTVYTDPFDTVFAYKPNYPGPEIMSARPVFMKKPVF